MKSLKFWVGLVLLAITASACSKSKGGGGAAPPPEETKYHLVGNVCYDDNDQRVDYDYCLDDDGDYTGGRCTSYIYYTDCQARTGYRVDCRNNALAVECQDPEGYAYPNEIVDCTSQSYDFNRYCTGSY